MPKLSARILVCLEIFCFMKCKHELFVLSKCAMSLTNSVKEIKVSTRFKLSLNEILLDMTPLVKIFHEKYTTFPSSLHVLMLQHAEVAQRNVHFRGSGSSKTQQQFNRWLKKNKENSLKVPSSPL